MRILILPLAVLAVAAGCGQPKPDPAQPGEIAAEFNSRAKEVAQAWANTELTSEWTDDLVFLDNPVSLAGYSELEEGLSSAYNQGWYELDTSLTEEPATDQIQFQDGTLPVEPLTAGQAYDLLAVGGEPPADCPTEPVPEEPTSDSDDPDSSVSSGQQICGTLVITDAQPATGKFWTSRGLAEFPTWEFTAEGVSDPIIRLAMDPPANPELPEVRVGEFQSSTPINNATYISEVGESEIVVAISIGSCSTDPQPLVYETETAIVVAGTTTPENTGEPCPDMAVFEPVSFTLDQPVGQRVILDAVNGTVLTKGGFY